MKARSVAALLLVFSFLLQAAFIYEQAGTPTEVFFRDNPAFDSFRFLSDARVIEADGLYGGLERRQLHAVYPSMIAAFEKVLGPAPVAFLLLQAALNCAMFFILWLLTRHWFGDATGIVLLVVCALYGSFVFHAAVWLREIAVCFLAVAVLALLVKMEEKGLSPLWALAAGVAAGLLMETRPYPLLLIAILAALAWFGAKKREVAAPLAFLAGCAAVMAVFPSPGLGDPLGPLAHFLSGNVLDGAYGYLWLTTPTKERILAESGGDTVKGLWLFMGEVARHPLEYTAFYFKKLQMLFGDFEVPSNYNIYLFKEELSRALLIPFLSFGIVFPFAVAGMAAERRNPRLAWLFLFALVTAFGVYIFPIQERYRLIMLPFFFLFAARGAVALFDAALRNENVRLWHMAALFLAALFICRFDYWPLTGVVKAGDCRNLALAYHQAGDEVRARYFAEKSAMLEGR